MIMISLKKILVPIDFSEFSERSLLYGISLAEQYDAELYIFSAIDDRIFDDSLFVVYAEQEIRHNRKQVYEERLKKTVEEIKREHPQLRVHQVLKLGIAFVEIVRFAKQESIDLIIMGSHGRTGITHLLIGSTTEKVVRKAPCPVLTVRPKEHEFVHP
jgi:nucleotide-binding universal stress UspA family protein